MTSWSEEWAHTIGKHVRLLRGDHSAQWLSDETRKLNHTVSRTAISEYETGKRKTMPISDLVILATALHVSPGALMYPGYPDGEVEVLPSQTTRSENAFEWLGGEGLSTTRADGTVVIYSTSTQVLVDAVRERAENRKPIYEALARIDPAMFSTEERAELEQLRAKRDELDQKITSLGGVVDDG